MYTNIFTSHISGRGNRIGPVCVCVCVCLSVCLSVCYSALSRLNCDVTVWRHDIMWGHVTSHNKLWGKRTRKYPTQEVRERSGVFIAYHFCRPCFSHSRQRLPSISVKLKHGGNRRSLSGFLTNRPAFTAFWAFPVSTAFRIKFPFFPTFHDSRDTSVSTAGGGPKNLGKKLAQGSIPSPIKIHRSF